MALEKTAYTARAVANGGREGSSKTVEDAGNQGFEVKLAPPKEMGGNGQGNNPEQMFAAGYAACFLGAMKFVSSQDSSMPKPGADTKVHSSIGIGPRVGGGFGLSVELTVEMPGVDKAEAQKLVDEADKVCPYSNSVKGNVDKTITVA